MRFAKYHGLGNDFVIVDLRAAGEESTPSAQDPDVVRAVCDRQFGVGGDGILAVLPAQSAGAHARMRVLNADGGEAEMCGNGLRCVVKYLYERDPELALDALTIDTGAGPLTCRVGIAGGQVSTVTVDMGRPRLTRAEIPMTGPAGERCVEAPIEIGGEIGGRSLQLTGVSMGNPHAIAFVDETGATLRALAETAGPPLEVHAWFPRKTNVEFARVLAPDDLELVVWERGVGITLACGTGACATAVAACLTGRSPTDTDLRVRLLGGDLIIRVPADYSTVFMTGPATHVFDAEIELAHAVVNARPS
ncbi:MAG TPA: diaminopimelate epimerase [Kofleriaceae bacterium]|nr:diaminopimelate epimerase [Kofleriaceae bacterium]